MRNNLENNEVSFFLPQASRAASELFLPLLHFFYATDGKVKAMT